MSAKITEIIGSDGEKIYIQYDDADSDELQAVGYIDDIQERSERLQKMMISTVRNYSGLILNSVKQGITDKAPSKVTMEFGLQAGGETGVPFVTKGSAQANVKVTIEWNLSQEESPQKPDRLNPTTT
ncbi:MAG: CU044_2847 family protein [Nostoc sp.]|uniref:CU044_2847 family protein n=1 Tax=Nostoc sp. TaxID=1180 RepID=UPI002FFC2DEA